MKRNIILIIKGFFFGIANIIPGVSGGTIALTMGIYEEMIESISHFLKDIKKSFKFLLPIGIGAALSILLMSKVISRSLENFPIPTTLFFIGLIIGGIPLLTKKVKKEKIKPSYMALFLLTFAIIIGMEFLGSGTSSVSLAHPSIVTYLLLFLVGIVAAATMVIPGVSGSFVLMLLGFYKPVVNVVSDLTNFGNLGHNMLIMIPFGIGVLVGIIGVSKLIEFLFEKFEIATYYAILGFIVASILVLVKTLFNVEVTALQIIIGIILFIVAMLIGYKLGDE